MRENGLNKVFPQNVCVQLLRNIRKWVITYLFYRKSRSKLHKTKWKLVVESVGGNWLNTSSKTTKQISRPNMMTI